MASTAAVVHADEAQIRFDHYNPAALNERAVQDIRDGDTATALILLERAVLLAPHEAGIRRNLEMLKAWRDGQMPAGSDAATPAQTTASRVPDNGTTLPPFPLWPKKVGQ